MPKSRIHIVTRATGAASAVLLMVLTLLPRVALGQSAPDAPAQLSVDDIHGHVVTLSWNPPPAEVPDAYLLEGGIAPRHVLGSLALGNASTSTSLMLPSGVYYLRTYAVNDGQRSAASNEVRVTVGMLAPPSAPEDVRSVAVGHGATVTWRSTFDGGAPNATVLDVVGPIRGTFPAGNDGTFRVDNLPDGIYTVRLRSLNAAGSSPSTAPMTVRLPGLVPRIESGPSGTPGFAGLPVRYEQFDAPRLRQLLVREGLDRVLADATSEFDGVLRLKEWVAAQFPHSDPSPYPPWDAIIVLDMIRAGVTGGFCAQYAHVMVQALAGMGVPARYIEIGTKANPYAHYLFEYWSNQFNKWVVLDVDFNLHFERNGVPMSALEVHDALVTNTTSSVTVVDGTVRSGHPSSADWPVRTMELYYYLRFHLKADHVSAPAEEPFDRWNDMVEWHDVHTTPWEHSTVASEFAKVAPTARSTPDRATVEAPLNQVWVTPGDTVGADVLLELAHDMPNIAYAEYRVMDASGHATEWRRQTPSTLRWHVGPDDRVLEVRGVNVRGVAGPVTSVRLMEP